MTAEFAVALPAIALVLALSLASVHVAAVQVRLAARLMELSADTAAAYQVRAGARAALRRVSQLLPTTDATAAELRHDILRHLANPDEAIRPTQPSTVPQGEPIGN